MLIQNLTVTEYSQAYYDEHKDAGLDYLGHGYWQEEYAKMVTQACKTRGLVIDAGCACGSILKGFAKLNHPVLGIDLNESMIQMGAAHFDIPLYCGSMAEMPVQDNSANLIHTAQVLEHIPADMMDAILTEFNRVLSKDGRLFVCLDAVKDGETKEMYMGDPTHVNIQPINYWYKLFDKHGFVFDVESYNRFVCSPYKPTEENPENFFNAYPYWSVWILQKR